MEMKKESRHTVLQHELTTELKSLRQSVRDTAAGFILCKEGEIEALLDYLLKMSPSRLKDIARPWLRETHNLKLKPDKGRIKDLKKIDCLLHELQSSVIEADYLEQNSKPGGKKVRSAADGKKKPLTIKKTL